MRRRRLATWAVLLLALSLTLAVAAGCGGDSSDEGSGATTDLSAEEIVAQSEAKMAELSSASFVADLSLQMEGDAAQMDDPMAAEILKDGVKLHVEGASASDPTVVDMTMNVALGSTSLDLAMLAEGEKAWVQYAGTWYAVDQKNSEALGKQADEGAAPTEQLKSMGLDPSGWGTAYELVGSEDLAGTEVFHISATADPQKLAEDLAKAAEDPDLATKLGDPDAAAQLEEGLTQSKAQLDALKEMLKDVSVDYWIGVDDMLMRKATFNVDLKTEGQEGMEGVAGMTLNVVVTMDDFDEPVSVDPPADAEPFDKLMEQMFGGMMGGSDLSF